MGIIKGLGDFFALDIGTNSVRVVQLSGLNANWSLDHYGYSSVDVAVTSSDSAESRRRLGEVIMTAIGQSGIRTKNVVIGLPSSKTFTTVIDVPKTNDAELRATMKYQIEQYIPMSADEAKVDWALLGDSLHAPGQQEVLLTSVARVYSEERLEFIEGLGLEVIAAEPDPIAMIRALVPANNQGAVLLLDMGEFSTDIAIVYGDAPRLIRTVPVGISSFIKAASQNLNVQEDQARQFILKFGLAPDRLDGQVLKALDATLGNFVSEITKSVRFFQTRYPSTSVTNIYISGFAAVMPLFTEYIAAKAEIPTTIANPWTNVSISQSQSQQLGPVAHEFATVIGLAKRRNS